MLIINNLIYNVFHSFRVTITFHPHKFWKCHVILGRIPLTLSHATKPQALLGIPCEKTALQKSPFSSAANQNVNAANQGRPCQKKERNARFLGGVHPWESIWFFAGGGCWLEKGPMSGPKNPVLFWSTSVGTAASGKKPQLAIQSTRVLLWFFPGRRPHQAPRAHGEKVQQKKLDQCQARNEHLTKLYHGFLG